MIELRKKFFDLIDPCTGLFRLAKAALRMASFAYKILYVYSIAILLGMDLTMLALDIYIETADIQFCPLITFFLFGCYPLHLVFLLTQWIDSSPYFTLHAWSDHTGWSSVDPSQVFWWNVQPSSCLTFPSDLRQAFRKIKVLRSRRPRSGHSHPDAGPNRDQADNSLNNFIIMNGCRVYSVQKSSVDIRRNISGSLIHYWDADRFHPEHIDPIGPDHIIKLMNVDYYLDWQRELPAFRPFIMYTFTP